MSAYNLRNCAYLGEFEKEKIVWQEIVQNPCFYFDTKDFYPEATTFIMTSKSEDLKYLLAILNSNPGFYFFKTFYAGGGLGDTGVRYKKAFLENFPIPKPSKSTLPAKVDKLLALKSCEANEENEEKIKALEEEIDAQVYSLYDLIEEEIAYINNALKT